MLPGRTGNSTPLRTQVAAVLDWCDLVDARTDGHPNRLHTSTIRAALAAAAAEAREMTA